jgi:DNA-binding winged helix-turn-helix (wHTH) protein/tetratricopeptide (TPR) repeat protein
MDRQILRFGDCRLDIAARELLRGGERIVLAPTVFDCIAYLIAHRDRAVGRDELVAAVWGKTVVSDTMLGKAILAARRAVGDTAEVQAFLRTVPRFGYHWVAPTQVVAGDAQPASTVAEPARATSPARSRHALFAALVAAVIALVGIGIFLHGSQPPDDARADAGTTDASGAIAVLPADVLAAAGDDWLRLGLMDLLATRLRDAGVRVMPSDSVMRVVSTTKTTDAAIAALGSAHALRALIVPAVRRNGNEWIVHAELLEANGTRKSVQAGDDNAIAATEQAANRMLALLGRRSANEPAPTRDIGLTELLQRTDAARLAENLELARAVIAGAPAALQALPEVRERGIRIDLRAGQFEPALARIDALLAEVTLETDAVMHARLLENRCVANMRLARMDAARIACDEAIRILDGRSEPLALGRAYNDRGVLNSREGHRDAALADFSRARVAITLAGDPLLLAQLDGNESTVEMVNGRPAEALPTLERAGDTFRRFGMINEFVTAVVNEIDACLMLLRPLDALKASDGGWSERTRISDPQIRDAFDEARANALAANGRISEARALFDALIHREQPRADDAQIARAQLREAEMDFAIEQFGTAQALSAQALRGFSSSEDDAQRAHAWLVQVRALRALGRSDDATRETNAFSQWSASRRDARVVVNARLSEAEQAGSEAHWPDADAAYEAASAAAAERGSADLVSEVASAYATSLLARGEYDRAAVIAGKVARHAEQDYATALLQVRLYHALGQAAPWQGALAHLRQLAGERPIPDALTRSPASLQG